MESATPLGRFDGLESLWLQVAGTLCNVRCTHCFISCGPGEDRLKMMNIAQVEATLAEARELGVREIYFTGGEPFLHPAMLEILRLSLCDFPTTVLTNGMLILERTAAELAALQQAVIDDENVFARLMDAVRVCSLGQITDALFAVGGQYRRSM